MQASDNLRYFLSAIYAVVDNRQIKHYTNGKSIFWKIFYKSWYALKMCILTVMPNYTIDWHAYRNFIRTYLTLSHGNFNNAGYYLKFAYILG